MSTVNSGSNSAILCPRCQRANPGLASYCYHDGIPLQSSGGTQKTSAEMVFPSGRVVHNPEELFQASHQDWSQAVTLLQRGEISRFLQRLGRMDLVRAVEDARTQSDPDLALFRFLDALPGSRSGGPRLDLEPRRIQVAPTTVGSQPQVNLTVTNRGSGLLQGKVVITEGQEWLRLLENPFRIQAVQSQTISLQIDTQSLIAGQSYTGKLMVISNGGVAELPVRLDLKAIPFAEAPYQGAITPRELAQRMLTNPRPAVGLLESGQVASWFRRNGWNYPVTGTPARGIGCVQQFFESLGLSKPPPLQLSENQISLMINQKPVAEVITLRTASRKWVYAQVDANVPWIQVLTPSVSGPQEVTISFTVLPDRLPDGGIHRGNIRLLANGNQKLRVGVEANVKKSSRSLKSGSLLRPVLACGLLFLLWRLILVLPADGLARWSGGGVSGIGTLSYWHTLPPQEADYLRWFVLGTGWTGALLGCVLVSRAGGRWGDCFWGLIAGGGIGLAGWSILGCLLLIVDGVPRWLIGLLASSLGGSIHPMISTLIWLGLVFLSWSILGGLIGLVLGVRGSPGLRLLAEVCRFWGLGRLAEWVKKD